MIARFDHAVIALPDLDAAVRAYRALGFDVAPGGRHPALGTLNAIVRFGLDYLELLAVEDAARARARGPFGAELAAFTARTSGLAGFVLASDALDDVAAALVESDIAVEGPFAMDRARPDGRTLAWRLVLPGASPWRKVWPFLIEWTTPDAERLRWDGVARHPNRVCGVRGLDLVVGNLAEAIRVYESAFELEPRAARAHDDELIYELGDFVLRVTEPVTRELAQEYDTLGPGPYRLTLASSDLNDTARVLSANGIAFERADGALDIAPDAALGARLRIVAG